MVLIAHSKGGLIGKQALGDPDTSHRVKHLIAINTPFAGSRYANLFLLPQRADVHAERRSDPAARAQPGDQPARSARCTACSIPHIPETSHLEGAENIVLPAIGHFRPVGDPLTLETIDRILARLADDQPG